MEELLNPVHGDCQAGGKAGVGTSPWAQGLQGQSHTGGSRMSVYGNC